ncbi:class I SAM-dependent methyltransferase [Haloimpatiens lingqiaonensis]|uniref:class I SAM-dependent methyltransferase n=1 Tax=Haloimpatiens lingqiaonensis TaxID=1380675 RepID=UPI0010FEA70B|nr:class I SAM-dependent methyltransferase [Haloimpatiens lingqiaonensis]
MNNSVKKRFDNASKEYVTDNYIWRYRAGQLVSELANPNVNDVILDMGCGTGKQIIELSNTIKCGIGIDISEGMIRQSTKNASDENRENVEFFIGTFDEPDQNIDLKEKRITKIISNYALHHLNSQEKKKAIENMVYIGGQSLQTIVIGDLMFFENPDKYEDEYDEIGYGPGSDQPSTVEELVKCFSELNFNIEVHQLHPLVGVLVASKSFCLK